MNEYLLKKVADFVFDHVSTALRQSKAELHASVDDLEVSLDHHLRFVKNWCGEISFADLKAAKATSDVFIPLDLSLSPKRVRASAQEAVDVVPLEQAIEDPELSHLIILGQPGAGKTTSMKHICQRLLVESDFLAGISDFPMLIRLRDLNARSIQKESVGRFGDDDILMSKLQNLLGIRIQYPTELIGKESAAQRRAIRDRVVIGCVDSLRILLILDGFDEVASRSRRKALIAELRKLAHLLEKSRIVLTSRTGEFNYHIENMSQFEISPLSDAQLLNFASRWLGSDDGSTLLAQIRVSPFSDTAIRPLTLAHLCAIYERSKKIPDKPKTVYRKVVNLLLEEWDEQRSVTRESAYANFDVDRKFEFLANLAYVLTTSLKGSVFSKDDVVRAYTRFYENFGLPKREAHKVANELETHTGLFVQAGYELFEFSHKSLQEYLTAEFIVRLPAIPTAADVLKTIPNELAVATAISSRPGEYFAELVFARFQKPRPAFPFVRAFVSRLLLEKPDFENTPRVGVALLLLYSQYLESGLQSAEQLHLFVLDSLGEDFAQLAGLIRQRIGLEQLLEIYEVLERPETPDGKPILRLRKRKAPGSNPRGLGWSKDDPRAILTQNLPDVIWVRGSLLGDAGLS